MKPGEPAIRAKSSFAPGSTGRSTTPDQNSASAAASRQSNTTWPKDSATCPFLSVRRCCPGPYVRPPTIPAADRDSLADPLGGDDEIAGLGDLTVSAQRLRKDRK